MSKPPASPHTPEGWDAASEGYAANITSWTADYAPAIIERLELDPGLDVLEVAAGSGALTTVLSPKVKSILATDFSPRMLEQLRARLDTAGVTNVDCRVMDGQALDVEDRSFDRAVCNFGLMLFPDRGRGFSELRRALKPGGRAVVSGWTGPETFESFGLFVRAVQRALPDLPPPPGPPPIFSLADTDRFAAEMRAAGFEEVRVDLVERVQEAPSREALWTMFETGAPPARALFERVGPAGAAKVREALLSALGERFGDGPIRLRNVATVGVGVA